MAKFSSTDNPTLLNLPNNIYTVHEQIEANNDLTNLSMFVYWDLFFCINWYMKFNSLSFLELLTLEEIIHDSNNVIIRKKLSPILSLWKKLNSNSQSLLRMEYDLEVITHLFFKNVKNSILIF